MHCAGIWEVPGSILALLELENFFIFPALFNLMQLSNAHTKCMEILLVFKLVISMLFWSSWQHSTHCLRLGLVPGIGEVDVFFAKNGAG